MTAALEGGEWSAARPGRTLPPGKTPYPFHRRLGEPQGRSGRAENVVPTGIRSRIVQPAAQSLYWLNYPGHELHHTHTHTHTHIYIYIYIYIYATVNCLATYVLNTNNLSLVFCYKVVRGVEEKLLTFLNSKRKRGKLSAPRPDHCTPDRKPHLPITMVPSEWRPKPL